MTTPSSPASTEPKLQPPGAGLPFFQGLFLRYWLYPRLIRHYDGRACLESMKRETKRITELAAPLDDDAFYQRVLVDPLPALEDSSRYWSVAMVIEHLIICMKPMTQIAETLAKGQTMNVNTSPANVKPKGGRAVSKAEWLKLFADATAECAARLETIAARPDVAQPDKSAPRVGHPFFGPMHARGWIWVMGAHPVTHRRQVQRIIAGLDKQP
jgi:hypothetical protein